MISSNDGLSNGVSEEKIAKCENRVSYIVNTIVEESEREELSKCSQYREIALNLSDR